MASSYSTDLKLELMVTGEQAGLWGDITNTNLNILQQAIAGYESVALNATTGATLAFSNGALSNGKNAVLNLTGTLTSSVNVVIPDGVEKTYIAKNATTGSFAVTFKYSKRNFDSRRNNVCGFNNNTYNSIVSKFCSFRKSL